MPATELVLVDIEIMDLSKWSHVQGMKTALDAIARH